CESRDIRAKARKLGATIRKKDGAALTVASLYRQLPLPAMRCAQNLEHLATVYCEPCRQRLCEPCLADAHAGHRSHPYRYIDWSVRPVRKVSRELRDFVADAIVAGGGALRRGAPLWGTPAAGGGDGAPARSTAPCRRRDRRARTGWENGARGGLEGAPWGDGRHPLTGGASASSQRFASPRTAPAPSRAFSLVWAAFSRQVSRAASGP